MSSPCSTSASLARIHCLPPGPVELHTETFVSPPAARSWARTLCSLAAWPRVFVLLSSKILTLWGVQKLSFETYSQVCFFVFVLFQAGQVKTTQLQVGSVEIDMENARTLTASDRKLLRLLRETFRFCFTVRSSRFWMMCFADFFLLLTSSDLQAPK